MQVVKSTRVTKLESGAVTARKITEFVSFLPLLSSIRRKFFKEFKEQQIYGNFRLSKVPANKGNCSMAAVEKTFGERPITCGKKHPRTPDASPAVKIFSCERQIRLLENLS